MKKPLGSSLLLAMAAAVMVLGSVAQASQNGDSIAIAFGREYPQSSYMDPSQIAGVAPVATGNWNNADMKTGTLSGLIRDTNGVAACTNASVDWSCNNTWSTFGGGSNNNTFTGDDFTLMTGYMDSSDMNGGVFPTVTITGLPSDFVTYDVYVYTLGGIAGRPEDIIVNTADPKRVMSSGPLDPNGPSGQGLFSGPDYVEAIGDDPDNGPDDYGNYVVFRGQSGDLTILAVPQTFRAVINAVEIVNTSMGQ